MLKCLEFNPNLNENIQTRLKEILSFVYKVDLDSGLKLKKLLRKLFNDELLSNLEKIKKVFNEIYKKIPNQ